MENSPESRAEVRRIERVGGRICNLPQGEMLDVAVGGAWSLTSPLSEESVPHTRLVGEPQDA